MPDNAGEILIERAADIRRRLDLITLEAERDYWMKQAESLHDDLQKLFDDAKSSGNVTLRYAGEAIRLATERS